MYVLPKSTKRGGVMPIFFQKLIQLLEGQHCAMRNCAGNVLRGECRFYNGAIRDNTGQRCVICLLLFSSLALLLPVEAKVVSSPVVL